VICKARNLQARQRVESHRINEDITRKEIALRLKGCRVPPKQRKQLYSVPLLTGNARKRTLARKKRAETRNSRPRKNSSLLSASFMLCLFFGPQEGGEISLQNVVDFQQTTLRFILEDRVFHDHR
jgi:hypothetical protein